MKKENLHHIKETGFSVPKDYFKNFEDSILSEVKLNNAVSNTGFEVPDSYFENVEAQILKQVSQKNTSKVISLLNQRTLIYVSSIAAAVLLLFNLSIFETKSSWDSLDVETVENYLINENIGPYEIASTLEDIDFSEENFISQQVSANTIESYILDNIDIEDLINE
jgi:hypothetical protein